MPSPSINGACCRSRLGWGGFDSLDATNYFTASSLVGVQTGFHVQTWAWIESQAVASANRVILANLTAAPGNGWRFLSAGTNGTLTFACYDSTGGLTRVSSPLTVTAGHVGRPLHLAGGIRSGGIVFWVDGVVVGTPTAITSYAAPVSPTLSVGRRLSDTLSCQGDIRVMGGVAGGHYAPSDAEVLSAYTVGLANKDIAHIAGGSSEACWSFQGLGSAPATISPRLGAASLARVGTPTWVTA